MMKISILVFLMALSQAIYVKQTLVDYRPVIGILTQPVKAKKRRLSSKPQFNHDEYILQNNNFFMQAGGSRTIMIPYNIPEADLKELLPNINGVLLTGGVIELKDNKTGEMHPYYKTAKRIFDYSKQMKDEKAQDWPLFGVCQGYEIFGVILADDDINVMEKVNLEMKTRPIKWAVNPQDTAFWSIFTKEETDRMTKERTALHAHEWSISMKMFNHYPKLKEFMTVTQTDTFNGTEFIDAFEAKNYPIYGMMYHPEYQIFKGQKAKKQVDADLIDLIMKKISIQINMDAKKNSNKISGDEDIFMAQHTVAQANHELYPMGTGFDVRAFGYEQSYSYK